MPFSSDAGKLYIIQLITTLNAMGFTETFLDIGVGRGTYCKLFKGALPVSSKWIGIEAWEPYIERYSLEDLYDQIILEDVRKLNLDTISSFDIALCGDVLEHMEKHEAQDLVHRLFKKCPTIVISIPIVHAPQGATLGNPFEIHVKDDWSHEEVLNSFPNIVSHKLEGDIGVYFLTHDPLIKKIIQQAHNNLE